MKKEIISFLLLVLLFLGSLYNIHVMDNMVQTLESGVQASYNAAKENDYEKASKLIDKTVTDWLSRDGYTHIFIRHTEIDSATDAFFEYISDISAEDIDNAEGSFGMLMAHLDSLKTMEHISFGSIF